MYFKAKYFISV